MLQGRLLSSELACSTRTPRLSSVRQTAGRPLLAGLSQGSLAGGGKSGLHGNAVPGNARRGRPQGQCHRKQTAGLGRASVRPVRVKRCGKSAPRARQRGRHGKPHREQDQIGAARRASARHAGSRAVARVGRARRPVTGAPEEWSSPSSMVRLGGRDRTRLTGRLANSSPATPVLVLFANTWRSTAPSMGWHGTRPRSAAASKKRWDSAAAAASPRLPRARHPIATQIKTGTNFRRLALFYWSCPR